MRPRRGRSSDTEKEGRRYAGEQGKTVDNFVQLSNHGLLQKTGDGLLTELCYDTAMDSRPPKAGQEKCRQSRCALYTAEELPPLSVGGRLFASRKTV